jgi:hypothetical protein
VFEHIGGVMVRMLASGGVDCVLAHWWCNG